jgi:hypothetical protein
MSNLGTSGESHPEANARYHARSERPVYGARPMKGRAMSILRRDPENHDPLLEVHFSPQWCIVFIEAAALAMAVWLFA